MSDSICFHHQPDAYSAELERRGVHKWTDMRLRRF